MAARSATSSRARPSRSGPAAGRRPRSGPRPSRRPKDRPRRSPRPARPGSRRTARGWPSGPGPVRPRSSDRPATLRSRAGHGSGAPGRPRRGPARRAPCDPPVVGTPAVEGRGAVGRVAPAALRGRLAHGLGEDLPGADLERRQGDQEHDAGRQHAHVRLAPQPDAHGDDQREGQHRGTGDEAPPERRPRRTGQPTPRRGASAWAPLADGRHRPDHGEHDAHEEQVVGLVGGDRISRAR